MGRRTRHEEPSAGAEIGPLQKTLSIRQLVEWAGAAGDFYPVHYDDAFARQSGFKGVIVHGHLKYQFLVQMLEQWAGAGAKLRRLAVRYRAVDYPGENISCRGMVTGIRIENEARLVECEVWAENERQDKTMTGSATVEIPAKWPPGNQKEQHDARR